jgi:hypothetical protein
MIVGRASTTGRVIVQVQESILTAVESPTKRDGWMAEMAEVVDESMMTKPELIRFIGLEDNSHSCADHDQNHTLCSIGVSRSLLVASYL